MQVVTDPKLLAQLNADSGVPQGRVLRGPGPLVPGQVQGQALTNREKQATVPFAGPKAQADLTNTNLSNQKTAQQIAFERSQLGLQIKSQFDANPYVKAYRDALPNAVAAMNAPDNAQGDLALVYAFGKVMDPGSVVREGELNMANGTSPLLGQLQSYIGMVKSGKRLPASTRTGLIEAIRSKSHEFNRGYTAAREQYLKMANDAGLPGEDVIGPHDAAPFQSVEQKYIARNGTKTDPKLSARLDALIKSGASYDDALVFAKGLGVPPPNRAEYNEAVKYAKDHPGYKGSLGAVDMPTTMMERALGSVVGPADVGVVKGFKHSWDRAAQGLEGVVNTLPGMDSSSAEQAAATSDQMFAGLPSDQTAEGLGRIAGAGVFSAPIRGPLLAGAAGNVLAGDSTSGMDVATDAALGAVGGKIMDTTLKGVSQFIAPKLQSSVSNLAREGAQLTPGRFFPSLKKAEDLASSYPVVGSKIDDAMQAAEGSVSRIPLNRSLANVGQRLPDNVSSGHEAVAFTGKTLGDLYNQNLSGTQAGLDPTFVTRLNVIGQRANLRPQEFGEFSDIVQREIGGAFQGKTPGLLTGKGYKDLDARLGQIARGFQKNEDPYKQLLGDYVEQAQEQVRHLYRRQNPGVARNLRDLDRAYADFVPAQRAAAAAMEDGIPTPRQYLSAVRQNDSSVRKGATARGEARMQDFAIDASKVIRPERGNSGSADRLNLASPKAWTLGSLLSPLYSEPSLAAINYMAKRTPDPISQGMANAMRRLPPSTGGVLIPWLVQPGQGN